MLRPTSLFAGLVACIAIVSAASAATSPLADAPSAFVRAHADSPVQFVPWGEAAFARAKADQKPIYLIIGSFTQELARAMREQNFAREENAALLNEGFVCVVVDRDEHPDLTAFFQAYVSTVKQVQGWPLNIWLTPELKPFEGTTYMPPSDEWGKEGFPNAVKRVLAAWQSDPEAQRAKAEEALATLQASIPEAAPAISAETVDTLIAEGQAAWLATLDSENGGFGDPPRRLEPELLRFLLQRDDTARTAALDTLRAIITSPVRDPLDGGFFRSAGDPAWRQPSLQKMLADQARFALTSLEAATKAEAGPLNVAAHGALRFALSLGSPQKGFVAAVDGTPESIVPSFLWTAAELRSALGDAEAASLLPALGITDEGNLPPDAYLGIDSTGKNLPRFATPPADAAAASRLAPALEKLRLARATRPTPPNDSLATSGAHGLLLAALSRSSEKSLRSAAGDLAAFIPAKLILPDGRLRSAAGFATAAGPRDYALVIDGLLAFAQVTNDKTARTTAQALLAKMDALFWDAGAGRYLASAVPLAPAVWARVVAAAPDAGDIGSVESLLLLTLVTHDLADPARRAALAAAIAIDIQESPNPVRGDQLLALQAFSASAP